MAEISIVGPADGELALSGPATVRIIEDGSTTSHRLGMAEIVLAPHTTGPPQHRHERHDEGFYVVRGTVRFTSGERSFDAPPRTLVMVPPGAPHTFANPGGEPAVILNTFTPDLYVQYFRDLRELTADGRPPSAELITDLMGRYATEPATAAGGLFSSERTVVPLPRSGQLPGAAVWRSVSEFSSAPSRIARPAR